MLGGVAVVQCGGEELLYFVFTHYYIGGHLFTKLVISICLSLSLLLFGDVRVKALPLRSRNWRCGFVFCDSALRGEIWLF